MTRGACQPRSADRKPVNATSNWQKSWHRRAHLRMPSQPAILLVNDEPVVIDLCKGILAASGFAILIAADGRNGLDLYHLNREQIALIVVDAAMPVMGGVELARRILSVNGHVRFIIMTALGPDHPFPDDLRKSCTFLTKPVTAGDFQNAVNAAINSDGNATRGAV